MNASSKANELLEDDQPIRVGEPGTRPGPVIWLRLETPQEMCMYECQYEDYFGVSPDEAHAAAAADAQSSTTTVGMSGCADFNDRPSF